MEPWNGNDLELLAQAEQRSEGRWPPRVLFGKGIVAEGEFQPYMPLSDYVSADFLCDPHQVTPTAVRFSLASGHPGSGDTYRDLRAMEVKLYTREGNCSLASLSFPESMWVGGRDFFQLADELGPSERTGLRDQCGYLRYASHHPQALGGLLRLYGKRGIPASYASMESWSPGTILWRNRKDQLFFVRHRWVPEEEPRYLSENEGEFLCGFDPDSAGRRLSNRLSEGKPAAFELRLQLLPEELWRGREWRYCDAALSWPEEDGIGLRAGRLTLKRISEPVSLSEQLFCCCPDELVSGMELIEGSYLHQMAVIARTMQQARLGRERNRAVVNIHRRRQRPALAPAVTGIPAMTGISAQSDVERKAKSAVLRDAEYKALQDVKRRAEYYKQARNVWEECSLGEQERIVRALSQRLLFGAEDLQKRFLKEMENIDPQIAKQIENQLIF